MTVDGSLPKPRFSTQEENRLLGYIFRGDEIKAQKIFDTICAHNAGLSIAQQRELYIYLINLLHIYGSEYGAIPAADAHAIDRIRGTYDPIIISRIAFHK